MLAVIPARGGSKRLPGKNIFPVLDKPMIQWVIEAAQGSKVITDIIVSSESREILQTAEECGATPLLRPDQLAEDNSITQDVLTQVVDMVEYNGLYLMCLQANSPEVTSEIIDDVAELFVRTNRHDVRTFNLDGVSNGAVWMMRTEALFSNRLSQYMGFYIATMVDVHTIEDIPIVEERLAHRMGQ